MKHVKYACMAIMALAFSASLHIESVNAKSAREEAVILHDVLDLNLDYAAPDKKKKKKCKLKCDSATRCDVKNPDGTIYKNCAGAGAKKECQAALKECNAAQPSTDSVSKTDSASKIAGK